MSNYKDMVVDGKGYVEATVARGSVEEIALSGANCTLMMEVESECGLE